MSNTNQPIPPGPRKLTLRDYRRHGANPGVHGI